MKNCPIGFHLSLLEREAYFIFVLSIYYIYIYIILSFTLNTYLSLEKKTYFHCKHIDCWETICSFVFTSEISVFIRPSNHHLTLVKIDPKLYSPKLLIKKKREGNSRGKTKRSMNVLILCSLVSWNLSLKAL